MTRTKEKQIRSMQSDLTVRAEDQDKWIEGRFVVFNQPTELWPGAFEEVDPNAFDECMSNDVRALINHDTTLVLGRVKAGTLILRIESDGLWGRVKINPNDTDALNIYERVKRGDVSGCSFGFNIEEEETNYNDDGTVKWILKKVDLHEVSVCTFPAYPDTAVQARKAEVEQHRERQREQRKNELKARLKTCLSS